MSFPKTRPGNPDRGWNDPPMFNYTPGVQPSTPKRTLNKRVAYPAAASPLPGHAVLIPGTRPPVLNPVLSGAVLNQPEAKPPPIPIGLRDTPLGNQAPPLSPVQLLAPTEDASAPQAVPLLVPGLIPTAPQVFKEPVTPQVGIEDERLDDLLSRLSLSNNEELLQCNLNKFNAELEKYKSILTLKICDDIKRKLELIEDRWKKEGFSEIVKVRISQLAEALSNEETDKANQLHLALMVDHISEVNQWMMGVKRLIQQQQLARTEREFLANKSNTTDKVQAEEQNKGDNCDRLVTEPEADVKGDVDETVVSQDSHKTDKAEDSACKESDTQPEDAGNCTQPEGIPDPSSGSNSDT